MKSTSLLARATLIALFLLLSFKQADAVDAPAPAAAPQTGVQPATVAPSPIPAAVPVPKTGPISTNLRLFTCGHSFHQFIPKILTEIAPTAGIPGPTIVGISLLGGSPVLRHWWIPDDKNEAKKALIAGNVDVLTLAGMAHPDEGIADFAKLGFEHNPNIRVTMQKIWIPQDHWPFLYSQHLNTSPLDYNKSTIDDLKKAYDPYAKEMDDYVAALNKSLGKQVVFLVPDGAAVIALRERILAGTAPGLKQQSDIFADWWGHPRGPISLLSGYCHFAVMYRRSPVGLPPPVTAAKARINNELVTLLQQIAWDTVTHDPMTGVTAN